MRELRRANEILKAASASNERGAFQQASARTGSGSVTGQGKNHQYSHDWTEPEQTFIERWQKLIDDAGGRGRVANRLKWSRSTVYRDYSGETLPSDNRLGDLCAFLRLPDAATLELRQGLKAAQAAREARRKASAAQASRQAEGVPDGHETSPREPAANQVQPARIAAMGATCLRTAQTWLRRRSRRTVAITATCAALVAVVAITAQQGWLTGNTGRHTGASAQAGPGIETVRIPAASLSPDLVALGAHNQQKPGAVTGFIFTNGSDDLCLGINDSGFLAGQNGDQVQIQTCNHTAGEIWIPDQWEATGNRFTWLVNYKYQSKCMNADNIGRLADGRRVQLWNCYKSANEYWDFGDWYSQTSSESSPSPLLLDVSPFCLDADQRYLGNGDSVHIWPEYGAPNQLWH